MAIGKSHVALAGIAGAAVAWAALAGGHDRVIPAMSRGGEVIKASATLPSLPNAPGAPMSFADIFERVSPAVVSINVTSKVDPNAMRQRIPGFENFPFDLAPRGEGGDGRPAPKQMSAGSGFFISKDGYVVTNNHVIENADEIKVVLKDGKELKGVVVGRDEGTDLAVIKVDGHDFTYVDFENSAKPRVGDWVLAVGNPFSLGNTATAGIVSAYNRDIGDNFIDYIQIDAPINRGNSGGPTFDTYGRVIGVNTAIFSPSGGSVGIGFDIPAEVANSVTKQLMTGAKIKRGYIGATIQAFNEEMATSFGMPGRKGAVVADLVPGGPAAKAGVQPGDIVVAVNGQAVTSPTEMTREVAKVPAGDVARLEIFRDGKARTIEVHTGVRPSESQLALNGGADGGDDGGSPGGASGLTPNVILGLSVLPITPTTREAYSLSPSVRGLVVDGVKASSDAGDKGLKRGDVIVRAGDREVASVADLNAAVADWKKAGRASIPLAINRGGRTLFVPIKIAG
jgi:serine protease Do